MFGIEVTEIFLLLKQLGFVLAGAASLWGFVFSIRDFKCGKRECLIHDWLSSRIYLPYALGAFLGIIFHQILMITVPALAHEGIVVVPKMTETYAALELSDALVFVAIILLGFGLVLRFLAPKTFYRALSPLYLISFVVFFLLSSMTAWTGEVLANKQLFFIGHGFHSVFTLGTVLVLDYLMILSRKSLHLKEHIFPVLPFISKVIWVGLAFDFLSALLIIDSFVVTQKFLFMQTIIGILVINGIFLSGPITRKLFEAAKQGRVKMVGRWQVIANLSGVISVSSWLTITVVDFFAKLTFGFQELISIYLSLIVCVFLIHQVVEFLELKKEGPVYIH